MNQQAIVVKVIKSNRKNAEKNYVLKFTHLNMWLKDFDNLVVFTGIKDSSTVQRIVEINSRMIKQLEIASLKPEEEQPMFSETVILEETERDEELVRRINANIS